MKKIFLLIIVLFYANILLGEGQLSYEISYDENEGISHWLASYVTSLSRSWFIENITNGSFHNENKKKNNTDDTRYYLLNYIRNKVTATHFSDLYLISAYLCGEYDFGKNIKTNIAGLPYQYTLENGLTTGFRVNYKYSTLETEVHLDYNTKNYSYEIPDSMDGHHTEANLQGKIKSSLTLSKSLRTYIEAYHYNDLNESSQFDHTQIYAGLSLEKKLNYIHYLGIDAAGGYSDIDPLFPYTFRTEARLTSKFLHEWIAVAKLTYNIWTDNDMDGIYWGNAFVEFLIQKNISFTPNNEVSKFQMSASHYYLSNQTLLKTKLEFYIKKLMLSISYGRYIGRNLPYDNKFIGKIAYPIFHNVLLSYCYHFQDNIVIPGVNTHSYGIDVLF